MSNRNKNNHIRDTRQMNSTIPDVINLLKILDENNQRQSHQNVVLIMKLMEEIEGRFDSVNQELSVVKQELSNLQRTPKTVAIKVRLSVMIKELEEKVHSLQEQIKEIKENLNQRAGKVVANVEKQGVRALANVTKVLKVKTLLKDLNTSFERQFNSIEKNIQNINEMERKYREAILHVKNAGRVIRGKETQKQAPYLDKGLFAKMRKPYQSLKNVCALGMTKTEGAMIKVQNIEKVGEEKMERKMNIAEKLKKFEKQQKKQEVGQAIYKKEKGQEFGR